MIARVSRIAVIAALALATTLTVANATGLKVLHAFTGGKDGGTPISGLVTDGQGNFYGTTSAGGKGPCSGGCGVVFKIAGKKTTKLYSFKGGSDGGEPSGALAIGPDGSLYGVTQTGGASTCLCGTVFKIRPDGTEKTLYQFKGGNDGSAPKAGVILDADGNIYGTTQQGGSNACQTSGCGTVFKLTPDGTESLIHAFSGGADGQDPWGELAFDSAGNLYGTTFAGGTGCTFECGTLFKIKPNGQKSIVHNFGVDVEDGGAPMGPLIFDNAGTLWGTTLQGGDGTRGSLYNVTPNGKETVVWSFGAFQDGAFPESGVIFDGAGNLYGALPTDGNEGPGYIFKWSIANSAESIVYAFPELPAGRAPVGTLALDAKNNVYGVTYAGGGNHAAGCDPNGCGEAYKLPLP